MPSAAEAGDGAAAAAGGPAAAVLEASGLAVEYGRKPALVDVSFRFGGGALGLLGQNGAGKSSLLRALLGLVAPARGVTRVLGLDAGREPLVVRASCGYMPERECHIPGLTGLEFVQYCGRLSGLDARDARRRSHEVLAYVGLQEERYRPVDGYSRGMKQKAKLAAALVHDPALVLLDEPTNGLDPRARHEVLELVKDLAGNKGVHVVLSSHLLRDVESTCTDLLVLDRGRVRATGRIDALKQKAAGYTVRVAGEPEAFAAQARAAGLFVSHDERGGLVVRAEGALESRRLFALARAAGTPLQQLVPVEETLEDLYLRAVADR